MGQRPIAHLLVLYVDDDDDRHFEDEYVIDLGLDFEAVSPFLLGRDLAQIMTDDHAAHIAEFLERASPEQIAAHGPRSLFSADDAERVLDAFCRGLEAGRAPDRPT